MKKKIIASIVIACILYSCSPGLYVPAVTDAAKQQQLLQGRKLYVDHCSGCHNLYLPRQYDALGWSIHMEEMQTVAKITDQEEKLIFQYLTSQP